MADHEKKYCPRCNEPFECKVGSILLCQCQGLTLSELEKDYIRLTYPDCLCRSCLRSIRHEIRSTALTQKLQEILSQIKK